MKSVYLGIPIGCSFGRQIRAARKGKGESDECRRQTVLYVDALYVLQDKERHTEEMSR